jgi:hypothetical protein
MNRILLFSIVSIIVIDGCSKKDNISTTDYNYVYVVMEDNDKPKFDYEGIGMARSSSTNYVLDENRNIRPGEYTCQFIAMIIPKGEYYVLGGKNDTPSNYIITINAMVKREGDNHFRLTGNMDCSVPVIIQYVKMKDDANSDNEFPERKYEPGKHQIDFEGAITEWLIKEKTGKN